jgi:hypothetical protein
MQQLQDHDGRTEKGREENPGGNRPTLAGTARHLLLGSSIRPALHLGG